MIDVQDNCNDPIVIAELERRTKVIRKTKVGSAEQYETYWAKFNKYIFIFIKFILLKNILLNICLVYFVFTFIYLVLFYLFLLQSNELN